MKTVPGTFSCAQHLLLRLFATKKRAFAPVKRVFAPMKRAFAPMKRAFAVFEQKDRRVGVLAHRFPNERGGRLRPPYPTTRLPT